MIAHRAGPAIRVALVLALLASGCGAATRPFDQVALIPSTWEIVRVSTTDLVGATLPVLTIGRSNSARVALACGEIDLRYASETDGAALTFAEQRVAAACDPPAERQDAVIRAAITSVQAWRVVSETAIELLGGDGRPLLSLQLTTCDCPHQPPGTGGPTSS